jgi:hypothetical protein
MADPTTDTGTAAAPTPVGNNADWVKYYNSAKAKEIAKNPDWKPTQKWADSTKAAYDKSLQPKADKNKELTPAEEALWLQGTAIPAVAPTAQDQTISWAMSSPRVVNVTPQNALYAGYSKSGTGSFAGATAYYKGNNLLDGQGNITPETAYQTDNDMQASRVFSELATDPVQLKAFMGKLYQYDLYSGNTKPSSAALSGMYPKSEDFAGINRFLDYASSKGLTWRAAIGELSKSPPSASGGGTGGTTPSYSSTEDVTSTLRTSALTMLGRTLTPDEVKVAVQRIQNAERSATSASGGEQATSLTTAANIQAEKANPADAAIYATGNAIDRIFSTLGAK